MSPLETALITYAVIGSLIVWLKWEDIGPWLGRYVSFLAPRPRVDMNADPQPVPGSEPEREPTNPANVASEGQNPAGTGAFAVQLTSEQLNAVQRMITVKLAGETAERKPTKAEIIKQATGYAKGAGTGYQTYSTLYDQVFGQPQTGGPKFRQDDGSLAPPSYPVTSATPERTHRR